MTGVYNRWRERVGLTTSGLLLVVLALAGVVAAYSLGGRTLYLIAYTAIAGLIAAVIAARRRRPLEAERSSLPARAREGQTFRVELTLRARRRAGSCVLVERLDPGLGGDVRIPQEAVPPGAETKVEYTLRARLRGVYEIGPLVAEWSDPMGMAHGLQPLAPALRLIVHPATETIHDRPLARKWEDPPIRPPRTKPWPAGFEFYGMRDYVPGDDLRRVVWKAAARTGRLLVREYEQGITDRIVVVLDTDRSWHRPGDPSDTFEQAVRVAASAGARHLRDGFSVALETPAGTLAGGLRGPSARIRYLDELAAVQMDALPLHRVLQRLARSAAGAHVLIVTPHLDSASAAAAGLLVESGSSVLVAAIIWEESDSLTVERATGIGAHLLQIRPGQALAATR